MIGPAAADGAAVGQLQHEPFGHRDLPGRAAIAPA